MAVKLPVALLIVAFLAANDVAGQQVSLGLHFSGIWFGFLIQKDVTYSFFQNHNR